MIDSQTKLTLKNIKETVEKENQHNQSSIEPTELESSSWAIGTQNTPNNMKSSLTLKSNQQTDRNSKRYSRAKKRKNFSDDSISIDSDISLNPSSPNQDQALDFSYAPVAPSFTNATNQDKIVTVDNCQQKIKTLRAAPPPKKIKGQPPRWTAQVQSVKVKCKTIHANPNKPHAQIPQINEKLQQLANSGKLQHFQHTLQGIKVFLNEKAVMHLNPEASEITFHNVNHSTVSDLVKFAKELDFVSLEVEDLEENQQYDFYKEGRQNSLEIEGLSQELEEKFEMRYFEEHLIPGFSG